MIKMVGDSPEISIGDTKLEEVNTRYIIFSYNIAKETDIKLINEIISFLNKEQPNCNKCKNHYIQGCIGGYKASACKIHGNLEYFEHPMHDGDASKCTDYIENKEI